MSLFQRGKVVLNSLSVHRCARLDMFAAAVVAIAMLALPRPAAAHPPCCIEGPNPSGKIPPAGTSTLPGTTTNGPVNPDGFFTIGVLENGVCTTSTLSTTQLELFSCTSVTSTDNLFGCAAGAFTQICNPEVQSCGPFETNTNIKFTQAPGTMTPVVSGFPGVVDFQIRASGDLLVCSTDFAPFEVDNTLVNCALCPVPPPTPF